MTNLKDEKEKECIEANVRFNEDEVFLSLERKQFEQTCKSQIKMSSFFITQQKLKRKAEKYYLSESNASTSVTLLKYIYTKTIIIMVLTRDQHMMNTTNDKVFCQIQEQ